MHDREFRKGDRVKVSKDATYRVGRAAKAAKEGFLTGVLLTNEDPCCGCYVVRFTRNIGGTDTFGTTGPAGYLDEVTPRYMTLVEKGPASVLERDEEPDAELTPRRFDVGQVVRITDNANGFSGVRVGDIGVVVEDDGALVGLRMVKSNPAYHSLNGKTAPDHGYYMPVNQVEAVIEGLGVSLKVMKSKPEPHAAAKVERGFRVSLKVDSQSYDGGHKLAAGCENRAAYRVEFGTGDAYYVIPFGPGDGVVVGEKDIEVL